MKFKVESGGLLLIFCSIRANHPIKADFEKQNPVEEAFNYGRDDQLFYQWATLNFSTCSSAVSGSQNDLSVSSRTQLFVF